MGKYAFDYDPVLAIKIEKKYFLCVKPYFLIVIY